MRIIAFSDTHGMRGAVLKLFSETYDKTDFYIFCGDGIRDVEYAKKEYPDIKVVMARGNCDYTSVGADVELCEAEGFKIGVTHGHIHGVNWDTLGLEKLAFDNKLSLVVYGHTHCRECLYKDGVYYVNPGSLAFPRDGMGPSYAAIDIIPSGIMVSHADFER